MSYIQQKLTSFLNKRIPAAKQHTLDHKSIFIFVSKFGGLFLCLCVLLFVLGTNYQNNLMLLLCYFLLALFLVNLLASYTNFSRIHIQQGKSAQVFVGDNLPLPLWLNADNNQKNCPDGMLYFRFRSKKGLISPEVSIDANHYSNPVVMSFPCKKRGKLTLPRVTINSYFPLGLFRCWTHLAFNDEIMVFPKPIPCEITPSQSPQDNTSEQGNLVSEQLGQDDFSHLQAYKTGEPLHHIAWKQLAKGRGLVSKHFTSEINQTTWLDLADYAIHNHETLELAISQLTYQVIELSRQEQTFGLRLGNQAQPIGSGAAHQTACLTMLALYPEYGTEHG